MRTSDRIEQANRQHAAVISVLRDYLSEQANRHAAVISALRDYLASLGVPDEPAEVILEDTLDDLEDRLGDLDV